MIWLFVSSRDLIKSGEISTVLSRLVAMVMILVGVFHHRLGRGPGRI